MVKYYFVIRCLSSMDYKSLLNNNQYEAVSTDSQFTRVVAGAGSGKTRVLTYRLSFLISEHNVDPSSIVAIAFTNKVASEMKSRALSLLNGKGEGLTVSTFHSFCARFLRKEIDVLGFPNNFTIFDEDDVDTLIKNIGVDLGYKKNDEIVKYAIGYISFHKCLGEYPSDITLGSDYSESEKVALKIFHKYEERKTSMLSLDFDDLLLKTIEILEHYDDIRDKWHQRVRHILVDEFQDTNDVQYKLLKLLMDESTSLYVVGDPDQTIYTWRGANQEIILNFTKDFPLCKTIILDRNYRSTKTILDSANKLISFNKKRVPKDLYTENNSGQKILVHHAYRREEEASFIVDQIENLHLKGVKYKDIAVLYRAAYLTLPLENELMRRRIPYQIYGGLKFFQRKEIKDVLAYFRLLYNQKDDISFERIVNVPRRGIGDSSLDILRAEKENNKMSYLEYLDHIENFDTSLKTKTITALTILINKLKGTKKKLNENLEAYPKVLEDFIVDIGYFSYLADDDEKSEERLGNVKALFENITAFLRDYPDSTFDEYLENAALQSSQDEINDSDQLALMTIHVAKGLEFDNVFVMSLIEGIFPSERTMDENGHDGLEEERRLCYVAFTRAKKKLVVSYNTGYSFVLSAYSHASRFINEAGLSEKPVNYQPKRPESNMFGYYADNKIDDFYSDMPPKQSIAESHNNITDWRIGDIAIHEVFGRGIVTNVIDETIVEINFDSCGKKSILANHKKLSREERGGEA